LFPKRPGYFTQKALFLTKKPQSFQKPLESVMLLADNAQKPASSSSKTNLENPPDGGEPPPWAGFLSA